MSNTKRKTPAASLKGRKHGLGLPIHIKKISILLNIEYYIILVFNRLLYIHYMKFPIIIRDFPSDFRDLKLHSLTFEVSDPSTPCGKIRLVKRASTIGIANRE